MYRAARRRACRARNIAPDDTGKKQVVKASRSTPAPDKAPDTTGQKQGDGLFKPGQSGNPGGRPKGSRNRLGQAFLDALQADFEQHGEAVIVDVREKLPHVYLKVVASMLPKEFSSPDGAPPVPASAPVVILEVDGPAPSGKAPDKATDRIRKPRD